MSLSFLNDLDNNSGKTKYQKFKISIGIEIFEVIIPFSEAQKFEDAVTSKNPTKQKELNEVVKQFNGTMKAK